ncbi:MAG: hypothetical protein LQ351_001684 [Letrouitia transgressa]|nr:MAG: hypothetical protein LQ351_001684 [Letrouitia transgressa]
MEYSPISSESLISPQSQGNSSGQATSSQSPRSPLLSHTNTKTWVSAQTKERENWIRVRDGLKAMNFFNPNPNRSSCVIPRSFEEYLDHRAAYLDDRRERMKSKVPGKLHVDNALGGRSFDDGRSAVLAQPTVWCPWYSPSEEYPEAPWPSKEEMREEGDERYTSQFGRFLALPRNPGNETVTYKQRTPITQRFLDRVWDIPHPDDVGEVMEEEVMEEQIGKELLEAIDG